MTNDATSFWEFIANHHIEIPIIQRDYAQGREGKEYLRNNFLTNLKQTLDNRLSDGSSVLKLDFVYGSENNGKLLPLDGQQRLTTLWLLHWYVALKAGMLAEASEQLKNFTYETRISSREFCRNLCISENFQDYNDNNDLVEFITTRTWFYSSWKQDPTIQSMLRMIGGTKINDKHGNDIIDGLEELFARTNTEMFEKYWKCLVSKNAPIVFYYLPLKDFELTDDLYIKMNARGKQLTSFENFKADLIGYIEEKAKDNDEWKRLLNPQEGIPIKLDTKWTDVFWENHNNGEIDKIFFAFINRYLLNYDIIHHNAKETSKSWKLYGKESNDSSLEYDSGFNGYAFILSDTKILDNLNTVFNNLPTNENLSDYLPRWFKKFDFIPKYNENSISTLTQPQRVVFFGICRYLESCTSFSKVHFKRWMRVVCNLVENTTIDTIDSMISRMKLINELSVHAEDIYEYLSSTEIEIHSKASTEQLAEEIEKAKQILNPQNVKLPEKPNDWNEEKEWDWETAISEAEGYDFFNGAICFLLRNKNNEWDWSDFATKWRNAQTIFGENGLYKKNTVVLRYFISKFTEWEMLEPFTYDNEPSSWHSHLLSAKWSSPVCEMLNSSCFEVNSDYHSTFEGKQKAVQEELVTSNLLDYIVDGCQLHHKYIDDQYTNKNDNNVCILYKYRGKTAREKYIIANKRNRILASLYGGDFNTERQSGKIYTNQKIEGCDFFWGWDIHFIYVLDNVEYIFRWQHWNWIDMYEGDERLCNDDNLNPYALYINSKYINNGKDLIKEMNRCINSYLKFKKDSDQTKTSVMQVQTSK